MIAHRAHVVVIAGCCRRLVCIFAFRAFRHAAVAVVGGTDVVVVAGFQALVFGTGAGITVIAECAGVVVAAGSVVVGCRSTTDERIAIPCLAGCNFSITAHHRCSGDTCSDTAHILTGIVFGADVVVGTGCSDKNSIIAKTGFRNAGVRAGTGVAVGAGFGCAGNAGRHAEYGIAMIVHGAEIAVFTISRQEAITAAAFRAWRTHVESTGIAVIASVDRTGHALTIRVAGIVDCTGVIVGTAFTFIDFINAFVLIFITEIVRTLAAVVAAAIRSWAADAAVADIADGAELLVVTRLAVNNRLENATGFGVGVRVGNIAVVGGAVFVVVTYAVFIPHAVTV